MTTSVLLKACALWLAILVIAILNGTLREKMLIPMLGNFIGLIASGAILSLGIFLVAFAVVPWYGQLSSHQWFLIGLFWLLLTVLFEFSLGLFVQRKTLPDLFDAYTFRGGNIWPIVLVVTLVSPWFAAKIRGFF